MTEDKEALRRKEFEDQYGEVWTTQEAQKVFTFKSFGMGFAFVERKEDGVSGSLDFTESPRFYHSFIPS